MIHIGQYSADDDVVVEMLLATRAMLFGIHRDLREEFDLVGLPWNPRDIGHRHKLATMLNKQRGYSN